MLVKILLTVTLIFTFLFIIFFGIWKRFHEHSDDDLNGILTVSAICIVLAIIFGVMSLSIYLVWGCV